MESGTLEPHGNVGPIGTCHELPTEWVRNGYGAFFLHLVYDWANMGKWGMVYDYYDWVYHRIRKLRVIGTQAMAM